MAWPQAATYGGNLLHYHRVVYDLTHPTNDSWEVARAAFLEVPALIHPAKKYLKTFSGFPFDKYIRSTNLQKRNKSRNGPSSCMHNLRVKTYLSINLL